MDLSIVIASFNSKEITRGCLASVYDNTRGLEFEVIVVDNGSTDGSPQMIASEFPEVRLIRHEKNRGFAQAQNAGMLVARGNALLVLNSDVLFDGNPAKVLFDFLMNGSDDVGAVGPQVSNPDGAVAPSARRARRSYRMLVLSELNRHFHFKSLVPEDFIKRFMGRWFARLHDNFDRHLDQRDADFVDGMCAMFRRGALEQVGLFDEQFFFDSEIIDLSNRLRASGFRIVFLPTARVIHLGGYSRRHTPQTMVWTTESHLRLYSKYEPNLLEAFRRASIRIMRWRLAWIRSTAASRGAEEQAELVDLYHEMLQKSRGFVAESARLDERIPRLAESPCHPC